MAESRPVISYTTGEDPRQPRHVLPPIARFIVGAIALPLTIAAAGLIGMVIHWGVKEVGWTLLFAGCASLVASVALWWLAGVRLRG
jgi:hypothetical protein